MSPSYLLHLRRRLSVAFICVVLLAIACAWAGRQQAGAASHKDAPARSNAHLFVPDKGRISPEGNTITVNTLVDTGHVATDGLCSLREAIDSANRNLASGAVSGECAAGSSSGSDLIDLTGLTGTMNIGGPFVDITTDMIINGPGSSLLTIRRNSFNSFRLFNITSGNVGLSGITVRDGRTQDGTALSEGGGIRNLGTLTMTDVTVTANRTATGQSGSNFQPGSNGGGIYNQGVLTMTHCSVTANTTGNTGINGSSAVGAGGGDGGGISNAATLIMTDCVVSGNLTGFGTLSVGNGRGGGIYNTGTLMLTNTSVTNNSTSNSINDTGGSGAGIYNSGNATLTSSTISNNSTHTSSGAFGTGAGIFNQGGLTILASTVSNNTTNSLGGGIDSENNAMLKMVNSTISGNTAQTGGGLVDHNTVLLSLTNCTLTNNSPNGATVTTAQTSARNTIIAGNGGSFDVAGNLTSQGHNLIGKSDGTNGFTNGVNNDQVGTSGSPLNPLLGPLANNGGPSETHALLAGSPALNNGDACVTMGSHCNDPNIPELTTDQRGFNRIVTNVDIGAYEVQPTLANLPDASTNEDTQVFVPFDGGDTSTITSVTASSSNTTLVPNGSAHLSVAITGSTGVVTINPAADANGTTNITVTVNRSVGGPDIKTFMLTVNPVNDAPSFTKGADQTVNEDSGAQTVTPWATAISAGPANESGTVTFTVTNNNNGLFSSQPAVNSTGTLTYTPAANANGSAMVTVTAKDNGGTANGGNDTSPPQTVTITVSAVNDPPSFTKGANQTVNEDTGVQTVTPWATSISPGPNESGQTVTFTVTNNNNALFSSQPTVSSSGTLTYTPAANANGSATVTVTAVDNGGTGSGGNDTSPPQTFTITVSAVNDQPLFTKGANQTVNEDAGAQTVTPWATSISPGPDESGQTVTFTVTNNNNALFSSQPAVSSTGTLTYTPAADANGTATMTVTAKDDGGTGSGGNDTSPQQTFTITVSAVNDAPSFTRGPNQTANNNAGLQTIPNWATNISAGPANESSQTRNFSITGNTIPTLFTVAPAVSSNGTLSFQPASNQGGTATITVQLQDNGGTSNGGVDKSTGAFDITIVPVGGFVNFASSTGNTTENSGSTTVNVVRSGNTSLAATVNYATNADAGVPCSTANGVASPKCDFTTALGTLNFAAGETTKPITILISQDSFVEGPENITLTLSSPSGGAAVGPTSTMAVTVADDATEPPTNIIDDPNMFVRMHYHDFLNREADQGGLNFWTGQMTNCGASDLLVCRVNVSGAFFLSIEFQQTGYLVERMYKTAYADATATSQFGGSHQIFVPVVRANEFLTDTQRIGRGVVVNQLGWETVLENNKQAYALEFVQTPRFISAFPTTMTPAQFVDKLNTNAGGVLSVSERQTAINLFGNSVNTTNVSARTQALRQVAEDQDLYNAEFNRAFVLTEYIGYLRRNPNDAPDSDYSGYDFWLNKLNENHGDYIAAEMVKAFISSGEYRQRFGP
jgi:CSLREA domain-containing protein